MSLPAGPDTSLKPAGSMGHRRGKGWWWRKDAAPHSKALFPMSPLCAHHSGKQCQRSPVPGALLHPCAMAATGPREARRSQAWLSLLGRALWSQSGDLPQRCHPLGRHPTCWGGTSLLKSPQQNKGNETSILGLKAKGSVSNLLIIR